MKKNPLAILTGILLGVICVLLLFVFQVRKSQVAIVTTFGRVTGSAKTEPGAYFRLPWPIQNVYIFDQRIQNFAVEDKYDECLTSDSYNLIAMVYVGWKIKDPQAFLPRFPGGSIAEAENILAGLVRSEKTAVIARHPLSDFVSVNDKELKFNEIEQEILKHVQDRVNTNNYGIEMQFLGIKKLGFPESVTAEVFKRMQSERAILVSRTLNDGEREASNIRVSADSQALEILAKADATATAIKAEGQRDAASSFAIFQQKPELANFLLDLNALEASLKERSTLIFDQHTEPYGLFQGFSTNSVGRK